MTTRAKTSRSAGVYVRISQDRGGAGLGVERQEQDCRALAEQLGWAVVEVYCDNDLSAFSGRRRPDYERMITDIEDGKISAVISWHPDRLHRRAAELERYIGVCERHGIENQTVTAGMWDLSTPSGRMTARQLGAVSLYESGALERAVTRGPCAARETRQASRRHPLLRVCQGRHHSRPRRGRRDRRTRARPSRAAHRCAASCAT